MRVHHLNCGTLASPGGTMVCHVLLVETNAGLVLVDSGFGLADCADPARRLGPARHILRPLLRADETAARQVERMGFRRDDVRHIVVTHLDLDHIGGLADFPQARVHVTATEARHAMHAPPVGARMRYRRLQWAHLPQVVEHEAAGEAWRGFAAAKELDGIAPGIVLIPLPGHSPGHAAVAVDAGAHWVLHCGDAFYTRGTLDGETPVRGLLRLAEWLMADDRAQVRANHERLSELWQRADPDLMIVSAHDPELLARARAAIG